VLPIKCVAEFFKKGFNERFVKGTSPWKATVRALAEVDKPAKRPNKVGIAYEIREAHVICDFSFLDTTVD
jgi:hypothetical protein